MVNDADSDDSSSSGDENDIIGNKNIQKSKTELKRDT